METEVTKEQILAKIQLALEERKLLWTELNSLKSELASLNQKIRDLESPSVQSDNKTI